MACAPQAVHRYVRVACVELAFFEGGRQVGSWPQPNKYFEKLCANPATAVAGAPCSPYPDGEELGACTLFAELMRYETAVQRCAARSVPGNYHFLRRSHSKMYGCGLHELWGWVDAACAVQVQVRASGRVSLVHSPARSRNYAQHFAVDSVNVLVLAERYRAHGSGSESRLKSLVRAILGYPKGSFSRLEASSVPSKTACRH